MDNQQRTVAMVLLALQTAQPMPPELAMATLALDAKHQTLLKVAIGQLLAKNPQALPEPNPAMQSLEKVRATRMADGRSLHQTVQSLPTERRTALFEKAVARKVLPAPQPSEDNGAAQLPLEERKMAQRSLTSLDKSNQASRAASLRAEIALRGPRL